MRLLHALRARAGSALHQLLLLLTGSPAPKRFDAILRLAVHRVEDAAHDLESAMLADVADCNRTHRKR